MITYVSTTLQTDWLQELQGHGTLRPALDFRTVSVET
jgi:hypothetical protein